MEFNYSEFTSRNIGFINVDEQRRLADAKIFIPGLGGMGGVVASCLARLGVQHFVLADFDHFELSNLNRQVFANVQTIGMDKAEVTKAELLKINPDIEIQLYGQDWTDHIDTILENCDVAVNCCDDIKAGILLFRKAKQHQVSVIDSYISSLPNVFVVNPNDPRPEEYLNFPSRGKWMNEITEEMQRICLVEEVDHVLNHSTNSYYIDKELIENLIEGRIQRISFAPMVWCTACMMSYEVVKLLLHKAGLAGYKGIFYDPWNFDRRSENVA